MTSKTLAEENGVTPSERTSVPTVNAKQPFGIVHEQRGAVAGGRHAWDIYYNGWWSCRLFTAPLASDIWVCTPTRRTRCKSA